MPASRPRAILFFRGSPTVPMCKLLYVVALTFPITSNAYEGVIVFFPIATPPPL
jgi:hypothetical protein